MSFPTSPTNGQIAVVNNVAYQYATANTSWTRVLSIANVIQANVISANVLNVVQAFSITGNIATANYFIGNGAFLTGLPASYSNANVAAYLPTYTGNLVSLTGLVSTTGNISGNYILGNGALLTGVITSVANINNGTSNVTVVSSGGNVTVGVGGTPNVAVFATTGEYVTGIISASGNIISAANISGGNILTGGAISATGTLSVTGATTLSTASTGNLSSGNISTGGIISATANITGGNLLTAGLISAVGNITGGNILGGANVNATTHTGTTVSVTANITGGNLLTAGLISAAGNITGGNLSGTSIVGTLTTASQTNITAVGTLGSLNVTANTTSGNLITGGLINATGNITGGNVNTNRVVGTGLTLVSTGDLTLSATGNINVNNEYINNVPTPVADGDAVNKLYVDNFVTGLNVHDAVKAATPTTLATITGGTITYYNGPGSNGVDATLTTTGSFNLIDTVNVQTAGTRILVLNEANAVTNGVYVWSNATAITRATDYNSVPEVEAGDFMFVTNGNAYGNTGWIQTSSVSNIGFAGNNITFTQFSGSGTYNAGTGLTLTGTTFSVNASQTQVTAVGTLGSLSVTGNIAGGNLLTGGLISATGNITGGNVISGGVRVYKWTTQANTAPSGAVPGDNWYDSYADKLYLYINDGTGNVWVDQSPPTTFSNLTVAGNTTSGNLLTGGAISATGTVTGSQFNGSGAGLTSIPGANVSGTVANATYATSAGSATTATSATTAGTVTTAAQPNITSVGTLTGLTLGGTLLINNAVSPNTNTIQFGDNTGWTLRYMTSVAGTPTQRFSFSDQGVFSATGAVTSGGAITGTSLTVSTGAVTLGSIVNANANGVGNIGASAGAFNTVFAKATSAQYADLAEMYVADADYPPGTVLEFGGNQEVTISNTIASALVAGVVSTNPAHLMNSTAQGEYLAAIALVGRVPTLVIGPVSKGAMMVSAGNGYAQACATPAMGTVIGKAVESFNGESGTIEIVVGRL